MIETMIRNRLVNKVRDLLDEGFTEIDIKVIDKGYIINPTKTSPNNTKKSEEKNGS